MSDDLKKIYHVRTYIDQQELHPLITSVQPDFFT